MAQVGYIQSPAVPVKVNGTLAEGVAVQIDTSENSASQIAVEVTGTGVAALGILTEATTSTKTVASIWMDGIHPAVCKGDGTEITEGLFLKVTSAGYLVPVASNNDIAVAQALDGTTGAATLMLVKIISPMYYGA